MTAAFQRTNGLNRWLPVVATMLAALVAAALLAGRYSLVNAVILDLNGAEENVVYGIIKVMKGAPLYTSPEAAPFDVIQYTPLYYWLAAGLGVLFGVDASDPQQVYALGRTIGLILNVAFAAAGYLLARALRAPKWAAAAWVLAVFALLPRQMYARPDALYLMLFSAALLLFVRAETNAGTAHGRRTLAAASLACCAALLAKQTGVLPIGIIGAHLLLERRWKDLAVHAVICGVIGGGAIAVLCMTYGPEVLYQNVVIGVRNGFSARLVRTIYLSGDHWPLILVQVAGIVVALRSWKNAAPQQRAFALAVLITFVFGLLTSLKHGSSHTYYMENVLLAAAAVASLAAAPSTRPALPVHWAVLGLAVICVPADRLAWGAAVLLGRDRVPDQRPLYEQAAQLAGEFNTDPELKDGLVLITAHDHLENFLVGRSVITQKDVILLYSVRRHLDLSAYERLMENGGIRFVVSRTPIGELPLLGRSYPELRPLGERNGYLVFENSAALSR